jgi:hypothetical protein
MAARPPLTRRHPPLAAVTCSAGLLATGLFMLAGLVVGGLRGSAGAAWVSVAYSQRHSYTATSASTVSVNVAAELRLAPGNRVGDRHGLASRFSRESEQPIEAVHEPFERYIVNDFEHGDRYGHRLDFVHRSGALTQQLDEVCSCDWAESSECIMAAKACGEGLHRIWRLVGLNAGIGQALFDTGGEDDAPHEECDHVHHRDDDEAPPTKRDHRDYERDQFDDRQHRADE